MNKPEHKDFFGQDLDIGDEVAFIMTKYRNFVWGKIVDLTRQKVRVEFMHKQNIRRAGDTTMLYPEVVIKKPDHVEVPE